MSRLILSLFMTLIFADCATKEKTFNGRAPTSENPCWKILHNMNPDANQYFLGRSDKVDYDSVRVSYSTPGEEIQFPQNFEMPKAYLYHSDAFPSFNKVAVASGDVLINTSENTVRITDPQRFKTSEYLLIEYCDTTNQ